MGAATPIPLQANPASLLGVLSGAPDGSLIELASGTYHLDLSGHSHVTPVRLVPASGAGPVFNKLLVSHCSGFKFHDLGFAAVDPAVRFPFQVSNSTDVVFKGGYFVGEEAYTQSDTAPIGLNVSHSSGVKVDGVGFSLLCQGINHDHCVDLQVLSSILHDLHLRGVAGGASSLTIQGCTFHTFTPTPNALHPDVIFVWTSPTEQGGGPININGNTIYRGNGIPIQGIMVSGTENGPINGVSIGGNRISGMDWNSLCVFGSKSVAVTNNTVTSFDDKTDCRIEVPAGSALNGNASMRYVIEGQKFSASAPTGNRLNIAVPATVSPV